MKKLIKNNIHWVGVIDWELQTFHGNEYSTHNGSSYNSYLVQEEKTVLLDTAWKPFAKKFVENLENEIDLNKIDYIIANHNEEDHSGAVPELMKKIPNVPIYTTANGVKSIKGQYHQDWDFRVVKTGDKLDIGNGKELIFMEMQMLHWPDSMATYMTGDNVLFSNDAFGQHMASQELFNDTVDQCILYEEAMKYYANIINPFSSILLKKLEEITSLNLPIDIIATSHGVIWRDNPMQIVEKYGEWANAYQENQLTIVYDTMWGNSKKMAEKIAEGIALEDPDIVVKLFNITKSDENDVVTEVFKSKAVLVGSPTFYNTCMHTMAGFIHLLKTLKFKNKKAAAFGSYGWSGESAKVLREKMEDAGFEIVADDIRVNWTPDKEADEAAIDYGRQLAKKLQ